jgi:DNA polymerase-3 subunit beta
VAYRHADPEGVVKLTIQAAALSAALDVAGDAVGKDRNLPILANVLLEADPDGGLTITGTDLKTRAWRTVPANVERAGAVCLPPAKIGDMLGGVPSGAEIAIAVGGGHKAVLTSGRTTVRIAGEDPEGFEAAPSLDDPQAELSIWADTFRDLVKTVAFAAASDDSRPSIQGLLIESRDGELRWTAADGKRIAYRAIPYEGDAISVVVPAARLASVARKLAAAKGDVRMAVSSNGSRLIVESDIGRWAVKLIEDTYPNLSAAFKATPTALVTVDHDDIRRACDLVANISTGIDAGNGKKVQTDKALLIVGTDSLEVRSGDPADHYQAVTVLDAVLEHGEPLVCATKTGSLRDALKALAGNRVTLELDGPNRPIVLRDALANDRSHLHVLIQMVVANVAAGVTS